MIPILIVTHGDFSKGLLQAAEAIVGHQELAAAVSVSPGEPVASVRERFQSILEDLHSKGGPILVLADMVGGTPCNVVLPLLKEKKAALITGVNLYMLLTAFTHRKTLPLEELAEKALEGGKRSIANAGKMLAERITK